MCLRSRRDAGFVDADAHVKMHFFFPTWKNRCSESAVRKAGLHANVPLRAEVDWCWPFGHMGRMFGLKWLLLSQIKKRKKGKEIGFMSIWMGKEVFLKCLGLWSSVLAVLLTDFKWNITASYMLMHRRLVSSARYGSVDKENKAGPRLWNVWLLGDSSSLENNQLKSSAQTCLLITLASTNPTLQSHQPLRFLDTKVPSSLVVAFSPRPLWPLNDNLEWFCLWVWRRVKKFLWALTESKEA